jgi:hypothetical protein
VSSHQALLIFHLLVIALGIGFSTSNFINTRLALRGDGEAQKGLGLHRMTIARWGDGVIALIWLSGGLLLWMRGMEGLPGSFHVKLLFVVLLTLCHGMTRATAGKMQREKNVALLPRLSLFVGGVAISAVVALVLAVLTFDA